MSTLVNALSQHTPIVFANNILPHSSHNAPFNCPQRGGGNIISPKYMMNTIDNLVPNIIQRGGGDGAYTEEELAQMTHHILIGGGKIKRNQSISDAFFTLIGKRKVLAVNRKNALQKGFKTLLSSRKKMFNARKVKLTQKLGKVYARSPASIMVGRDMRQMNSNRIVLKSKMGRSMGRSVGRSASIAGGGKHHAHCGASCKRASHSHRHKKRVHFSTQSGGVGYGIGGVNLPANLSMLASPGTFTPYPHCSGVSYQHPA